MNEITTTQSNALVQHDANPIAPLLAAITQSGITPDNADALGKVLAMYERMEAQRAAKDFAAAFAAVQAEMPSVQATRAVPGNGGEIRYTFAPFDEIMRTVQPILARHGFSVSFDSRIEEGRMVALCTLTHASGHSRTNQFAVRGGKGPPGTNDAQADGSNRSYARRYALCDALNISIDHDTDARNEGDYITFEQARDLQYRVLALGPEDKYLKLADAPNFDSIRERKYGVVLAALEAQERIAKAKSVRTFASAGEWRAAMLETLATRGAEKPEQVFDQILMTRGYSSYLAFPADKMGAFADYLDSGKLDKAFKS